MRQPVLPLVNGILLLFCLCLTAFVPLVATQNAQETRAFARKYDVNCTICHTRVPRLNRAGERFSEDGYQTAEHRGPRYHQKITAGLFPNPELSIEGFSAFTQTCTFSDCRGISPEISQLFEVAGKRGFRVESAEFGTRSAEASFEDTLRQLSFAVKDTYYQIQVGRQHLKVDEKTRDRLKRVAEKMTGQSIFSR